MNTFYAIVLCGAQIGAYGKNLGVLPSDNYGDDGIENFYLRGK